jgi:hypothetical protein
LVQGDESRRRTFSGSRSKSVDDIVCEKSFGFVAFERERPHEGGLHSSLTLTYAAAIDRLDAR